MTPASVTLDQIMAWGPCYTRDKVHELMQGREHVTAIDILDTSIPRGDKLWAICHPELLPVPMLITWARQAAAHAIANLQSTYPDLSPERRRLITLAADLQITTQDIALTLERMIDAWVSMSTLITELNQTLDDMSANWDTTGTAEYRWVERHFWLATLILNYVKIVLASNVHTYESLAFTLDELLRTSARMLTPDLVLSKPEREAQLVLLRTIVANS